MRIKELPLAKLVNIKNDLIRHYEETRVCNIDLLKTVNKELKLRALNY